MLERAHTSLELGMLTSGLADANDFGTAARERGLRMVRRTIEYSPYVSIEGEYDAAVGTRLG